MLTRRHFIATSAALFGATPLMAQQGSRREEFDAMVVRWNGEGTNPWGVDERFLPTLVAANPGLEAGSIHVDPIAKYLYHIQENDTAMRYGVAIGRGDLYEPGVFTIRRKAEWPRWTPTANMIRREPEIYAQFAGGVPGGPDNPLGARALYLYEGNRDTYLRIHGTFQPWSIGRSASSGCVRLLNQYIMELYEVVELGVTANLHSRTLA